MVIGRNGLRGLRVPRVARRCEHANAQSQDDKAQAQTVLVKSNNLKTVLADNASLVSSYI